MSSDPDRVAFKFIEVIGRHGQLTVKKTFEFTTSSTVGDVKAVIAPFLTENKSVEHVHVAFTMYGQTFLGDDNNDKLSEYGILPNSVIHAKAAYFNPSIVSSVQSANTEFACLIRKELLDKQYQQVGPSSE
ncbi:hypothetical protein GGF41_001578 [Coemansia sp. RSA 2531]|nr:hypothetical protein GGF41_001578 [Coemansia sp. RSA 2531]